MKNIGTRHILVDIGLLAGGTMLGSVIVESLRDHKFVRLFLGVVVVGVAIWFDHRNVVDEEHELEINKYGRTPYLRVFDKTNKSPDHPITKSLDSSNGQTNETQVPSLQQDQDLSF